MFGLGVPELAIILVIATMLFGVGKLPTVGEGIGKALSGFRRGLREIHEEDDHLIEKK